MRREYIFVFAFKMLDEGSLKEFYRHVYPVDLIVNWLTYNYASSSLQEDNFTDAQRKQMASARQRAAAHLSRREFCFTLLGDIFTRFRSYSTAEELKAELERCFPEKIDVGAVYNIRPSQKQGVTNVFPIERELVFDIDMSDYDNVRSCCSGKSVCRLCWHWMGCAASVLKFLLEADFGFQYILPVFSGRRGIHLWVCDRRARFMNDDERAALVGYLSVVSPKQLRSDVVNDLANHRRIHPSLNRLFLPFINSTFETIFVNSSVDSPNNIQHSPKAAAIVYNAAVQVLQQGNPLWRKKFFSKFQFNEGDVLLWQDFFSALGETAEDRRRILFAMELLLLYPRLDEHVTTRRDHLLKLPFCVHPGTSSLCCPLEWDTLSDFNPADDPPKLESIVLDRRIDRKWIIPLENMISRMARDPQEGGS